MIKNFTPRELAVLNLLGQGYKNHEIANKLYISISTVKTHLEAISLKLGVSGRLLIALTAIRSGIIE